MRGKYTRRSRFFRFFPPRTPDFLNIVYKIHELVRVLVGVFYAVRYCFNEVFIKLRGNFKNLYTYSIYNIFFFIYYAYRLGGEGIENMNI